MGDIYFSINMDFIERCNTMNTIASYIDFIPKYNNDELEELIVDYNLLAHESINLYFNQKESMYDRLYGIAEFALSVNRSALMNGLRNKELDINQFQQLWLALCDVDLHIFKSLVLYDYDSFNNGIAMLLANITIE